MANVVIAGNAAVITSTLKLEDIKVIEKYRPKALTLMGGEDGKEEIFKLGSTADAGYLSAFGASFGFETRDAAKLATMTIDITKCGAGDPKEYVADLYGGALMNLAKIEAELPAVIAEINDDKAAVLASIAMA